MSCAALSSSVAAPLSARKIQRRRLSPPIPSPFVGNVVVGSAPSRRRWSRELRPVSATTVQEQEDNVITEGSFKSKSFPDAESVGGSPETSTSDEENWTIKFEHSVNFLLTETVIKILEILYNDRNYARFYVLETIARVPYFAFISVLHLYESFGWWRRADYLKVHFAESWNEMHHLLIMEELGGNKVWFDRFLAQNIAVLYYFTAVFMYLFSPRMAYHLSECVERHAYSSYSKFLKLHGEELKKLPAPQVAISYYMDENLYMFDEFHTSGVIRRPKIENLYDVFVNIRDDELEHCKTMNACQTPGNLSSPHSKPGCESDGSSCDESRAACYGIVDCVKKSLR